MTEEPLQDGVESQTDGPDPDGGGRDPIGAPADDRGTRGGEAVKTVITFSQGRFDRELWIDTALRRCVTAVALAAIVVLVMFDLSGSLFGLAVAMLCVFGWVGVSMISANVWRAQVAVTGMIGRDADAAELRLAELMKRRALVRWVRLLLYHRLAAIRHRQHRFAESAAICRAVLSRPLGPAGRQRGSLLLMLAEASLQCRDMHGAYTALSELQGVVLGLAERLQRLTIQTRYEVMCGHDRAALNGIQQKLLMAELMPAEHCGAMHAMLTTSAKRAGREELADWLWRRSELLCGREQLDRLVRGAFAIGVVGPPE